MILSVLRSRLGFTGPHEIGTNEAWHDMWIDTWFRMLWERSGGEILPPVVDSVPGWVIVPITMSHEERRILDELEAEERGQQGATGEEKE